MKQDRVDICLHDERREKKKRRERERMMTKTRREDYLSEGYILRKKMQT